MSTSFFRPANTQSEVRVDVSYSSIREEALPLIVARRVGFPFYFLEWVRSMPHEFVNASFTWSVQRRVWSACLLCRVEVGGESETGSCQSRSGLSSSAESRPEEGGRGGGGCGMQRSDKRVGEEREKIPGRGAGDDRCFSIGWRASVDHGRGCMTIIFATGRSSQWALMGARYTGAPHGPHGARYGRMAGKCKGAEAGTAGSGLHSMDGTDRLAGTLTLDAFSGP